MNKSGKTIGIAAFQTLDSGGVLQYTEAFLQALSLDKTNHYIVFCLESNHRFDGCGLDVVKLSSANGSFLQRVFRMLALFNLPFPPSFCLDSQQRKLFSKLDLVLSPVISLYPHLFAGIPFYFTLHDVQERYYPEYFPLKERLMRHLKNRVLCKRAKGVLCESRHVKSDIMRFYPVPAENIHVIPAPPPKEFLSFSHRENDDRRVSSKYSLPEQYVFYPANTWAHKNHLRLLEAFSRVRKSHPDVHLVLSGAQKGAHDKVREKIKEPELEGFVHHIGYIDYEDLPYLYRLSRFLVMPSLFESISIPVYEAFCLEVAVCVSNVVALPEQVGDAGLLFNPDDADDMAEKIIMYLDNDKLRKEKARKGRLKIESYQMEEYSRKLIQALNL